MSEKLKKSKIYLASALLVDHIATPDSTRPARRLAICALIFLSAFVVRLMQWQDQRQNIGAAQSSLSSRYKQQAQRMLDGDGILFPRDYEQHSSVQLIVHPPGYSMFIAGVFEIFGKSDDKLAIAQIILDSAAAVLVFLIGAALLSNAAATLAGLLVAFSPHLAHHSSQLLPDSLAVLPILIAIWLLVRTASPGVVTMLAAGAFVGLSCWLRSNSLLLALFLAVAVFILVERSRRATLAIAFVCATIVVILPITIRNRVVFGYFVPLSLGSGLTMIEGIADYDKDKRFGMPITDDEAWFKDLEWHNRRDYVTLWRPDGIERDRYRLARGLDVVRHNPIWFAGVMIRRAGSMLRYNDSLSQGWPGDTSLAPVIAAEPPFGHRTDRAGEIVWSSSTSDLLADGRVLSSQTECSLGEDGTTIKIAGNGSDFDDQFASAPIAVRKNTDYVLSLPAQAVHGRLAAKVTSADRRITLASMILPAPEEIRSAATRNADGSPAGINNSGDVEPDEQPSRSANEGQQGMSEQLLPFATGSRSEVVLVISNNGRSPDKPEALIAKPELYQMGETPQQWSRFVRPAVRGLQRNLYTTSHLLPLIGIGILLLAAVRRWRLMLVLLIVPAYYLVVQSALHTEYRYILAIHYFLFVIAAVTLCCLFFLACEASKAVAKRMLRGTRA